MDREKIKLNTLHRMARDVQSNIHRCTYSSFFFLTSLPPLNGIKARDERAVKMASSYMQTAPALHRRDVYI